MNKYLLYKILPYTGYGLKASNEDYIVDVLPSHFGTDRINVEMLCTLNRDNDVTYKPILFPTDCITREIETEYGKETPLIEMAKIAFPDIKEWWIDGNYAQSERLYFYFDGDSFNAGSDGPREVHNQWEIFQYLYSRHIAFILSPKEYVNLENLNVNPYKNKQIV